MNSLRLFFWPIIFSLLLAEYFLFRSYVLREIANFYPTSFDQAGYLAQSYITYENILREGFLPQFKNGLIGIATSYTFILQAVIVFFLFGVSRLAALSLNFIYFAALQLIIVKVVRNLTKKNLFAFLSLGLILSLNTPFYWAGGILDFRIDFMAFCLFGIFISCILASKVFFNFKWTSLTTFVGTYLILLRYITATYVFGILFLILGFLIVSYWRKSSPIEQIKIRIKHIGLSIITTTLLITPFLWSSRAAIYNYYVAGHFLTAEKYIRAAQVGVTNFISNIAFYPKSLLKDHIGLHLALIILITLLGSVIISRFHQQKRERLSFTSNAVTLTLFFSILVPVVILTSDLSKSPVVIGIISIPFIWLMIWSIYLIHNSYPNNKILNLFLSCMTLVTFSYGTMHYVNFMLKKDNPAHHASLIEISKMYEDIGNYMLKNKQQNIVYSSDQIRDFIISQMLTILYYEKHGVLLRTSATRLSGTIYDIPESEAEKDVRQSNIFITNLNSYLPIPGDYPFNITLEKIKPHLQKVADKELTTLGDYNFYDSTYRVYVKLTS